MTDRNKLVIATTVLCAREACEARFEGRVVMNAAASGFGALFGGQDFALVGYIAADIPQGWKLVQEGLNGAVLYCAEHVPVPVPAPAESEVE